MLYELLKPLTEQIALFKYITFRAAMSSIFTLMFTFIFGKHLIRFIKHKNILETIRDDSPSTHKIKNNTPTMGGIIIILSIFFGVFFWADFSNMFIIFMIILTILLGLIGITDDIMKRKNKNGLRPIYKLFFQIIISLIVAFFIFNHPSYRNITTMTNILFLKNIMFNLSILYIPFIVFVLTGTSNAVNLSDGLDGLAIGMLAIIFFVYTIIAYITGNIVFSEYLNIHYIKGIGELTIFLASISAACLGFLWYNSHPAEIFMGDTGSITLGGLLGLTAILVKQEVLLLIAGGVFVAETVSVILQVSSYKLFKKRIFPMTPIHHTFEKMGIHENKIVIRFWIISILLGILALSTLKLR